MNIVDVGAELIRRGWDQGSLVSAKSAQKASLARSVHKAVSVAEDLRSAQSSSSTWLLKQESIDDSDYLVVVSHPCDIKIPPDKEPYVEAMRAYRTTNRNIIYGAGKNNSFRRFLLRRYTNDNRELEGLVTDATVRVNIQKQDLLAISPQSCFDEDDKASLLLFRQWLGARYYRQALPDPFVKAITQPIIKAIEKLSPRHDYQDIFDGISRIFFQLQTNRVPFQIELFFEPDERKSATVVSKDDVAPVVEWLDSVLQKVGQARVVFWDMIDKKAISAYDYAALYEISLSYLSQAEDSGT